ncbi:hypothetical protein [Rhizobium sp. WYCCWR10014]|uniref:hypothetical protein n=1 Tax=Rhizobium sp. WYCCWR10014 TaxID=1825933 RepID=UPI000ABCF1D6|nr:hypothetical protein [Rhizobium sp. WYCCWR10014]
MNLAHACRRAPFTSCRSSPNRQCNPGIQGPAAFKVALKRVFTLGKAAVHGSSTPTARWGKALTRLRPDRGLPQPQGSDHPVGDAVSWSMRLVKLLKYLTARCGIRLIFMAKSWSAKIGKQHRQVCGYALGKHMIYWYKFAVNHRQNHQHVANFKDRQSTSAIFLI